jgi:RNA polymerase sigma-70 factor, ECF subfamily
MYPKGSRTIHERCLRHGSRPRPESTPAPASGRVVRLPLPEPNAALVAALVAGRADSRAVLFDRYGEEVERILFRTLGPDAEIVDLLQDVFLAAFSTVGALRDPHALGAWLASIAVRKARLLIRRRRRWRFLQFMAPTELPEREAATPSVEVSEALRCTYRVLDELPADDRIAFALRYIDGMSLAKVAEVCGVSLATAKRRITRGQRRFVHLAETHDVLAEWLARGSLGDRSPEP